ncbi:hypothetical protein [Haloarcula sp. Atlit-120R]|uniref:hypothetical protein n=1 Tax=Haloarcula sp. Atlit-120R TaxID=2282135 RepID=UPI000EF2111B|nr:hypothetical protein [Haloarcula sp. Atlit-120R]RLM32631.1 hypothetical protein DVK01_20370 [Haloarcula sp. Atlit-120R]
MRGLRILLTALLLVSAVAGVTGPAAASPADCQAMSAYESTDAYRQCLVENTTAEEVTDIVHSNPSTSSQKQIDAVYAISPRHDDEFGFNQTQKAHITDWMTWEKTGLQPAWYNESQANSTDGSDSETSGPTARQASVAIETPGYVGETSTLRQNNETIYVMNGTQATLQPQNFDAENVIGFGVVGSQGQLTFNDRMGVFEYDTNGVVGSAELYWEVEEQVRTDNGTETVRTRYVTTVRSEGNTSYEHYQSGEIDEMRTDAANWSEWESSLVGIYGSGVDIQQQTQKAVELSKLANNPLAALSGNFTGLVVALFVSLGGLLILALFGTFHLVTRFSDIQYIHRSESLKAEEKDIDDKARELNWREKMRSVAKWDWSDFFGDLVARAYQAIGRTPFDGLKRLVAARRPRNLVDHRIQAMGHDGYVGVVEREDVSADGGDDSERAIIDARVARSETVADDVETVDLTGLDEDEHEQFLEALDWNDQTLWNYDLSDTDATPADITVEQAPMSLEELSDALGADLMQFDSRQHWGQYLLEFVQFVREHDICDNEGRPDDIQLVLNEWMDADDMLSDGFELPHFKAESEALEWAVQHSDPVEEADRTIENVKNGVPADD